MIMTSQTETPPLSDTELVQRVQKGDKDAYNILVLRYQHKVCNIVSKYVSNPVDVNDVAQESFLRAYKSLHNFRGESSFYTWLYRITTNTAISFCDHINKQGMHVDVDDPDFEENHGSHERLASHDSPDRLIESEELQEVINNAISELPEELRQALFLREVEDMSYEDIATVLKTPIGTVRSRIFRARQYIEERMALFSQGF